MTESKETEYSRLASQVAEIEKLVQSGARSDAGYLLAPFLENARSRLDAIKFDETRVEQDKKERKEKDTAAVAMLVEREHNLNAQEKEQYGEFLKQDYFTRESFGALTEFYSGGAWDRLSDGGKTEMSHRVWEGIRRDEYTFDELPEVVRKKEADRLYQQFTGKSPADNALENIPAQDKADFIREHEAGNEKAASQVLSRESFSENVSTHSPKEASKMDASSSNRTSADEKPSKVESSIETKEDAVIEEVTFAVAGSLPPTQLPSAASRSVEKS